MTPEQFCYWLNGFVELNKVNPTTEQWNSIRDHLKTVFHKVTPPVYSPGITGPIGPMDYRPYLKTEIIC